VFKNINVNASRNKEEIELIHSFIHVYSSKKQYNRSTEKITVDRISQAMKHLRLS